MTRRDRIKTIAKQALGLRALFASGNRAHAPIVRQRDDTTSPQQLEREALMELFRSDLSELTDLRSARRMQAKNNVVHLARARVNPERAMDHAA